MKINFKTFMVLELDASKIETKLEYHRTLNEHLWASSGDTWILKNDVRDALMKIANEFIEFLEMKPEEVKDIIITGSSANYNWTPYSDIDLHLVADFSDFSDCKDCESEFVNTCFQAKKTLWNSTHDIKIKSWPVEVYVQDEKEPHVATGVWSLKQGKWIITPSYQETTFDSSSVKLKAAELMNQIDTLVDSQSNDMDDLQKIKDKIRAMRQSGLQTAGEFSVENLAFKTLRNNGYLDKLSNYLLKIKDKSLSLE